MSVNRFIWGAFKKSQEIERTEKQNIKTALEKNL
jgi:hypothetical protein